MGRAMATQVEELPDNKVRLTVEVPQADLEHAVEHATSDLSSSVKVPGFREGKVPPEVLQARIGRERIFKEAVESHIGGWFMNAAAGTRIRPIAAPEYEYELPASENEDFQFTATVPVQPKPEPADWTELEVPYAEPEIPEGLIDQELEELRASVAELAPVEGRPARDRRRARGGRARRGRRRAARPRGRARLRPARRGDRHALADRAAARHAGPAPR